MIRTKNTGNRRAGQPVVVLVSMLIAWVCIRSVLWQSPFPDISPTDIVPASLAADTDIPRGPRAAPAFRQDSKSPPPIYAASAEPISAALLWAHNSADQVPSIMPPARALVGGTGRMASHQLLWMAAMAQMAVPEEISAYYQPGDTGRGIPARARKKTVRSPGRWSFDGWLLLRPDSGNTGASANGILPATYGASQAGAVVRYHLAPQSPHRPAAYARLTQALSGAGESDAAVGIKLRPLPDIPLAAMAEARLHRAGRRAGFRPAVLAVTELDPVDLPFRTEGRLYLQAGYVGGDFATGFIDGQARIDRQIAVSDGPRIRAGAGLWGGAQKGAGRLDIGPTASVDVSMGPAPMRLSMDYRRRIAGDAEPQSGIAITLSTGF